MSLRARLAAADGFSLVAVLGVLLVGSLLATAAFAAVDGDLPFARAAQDRKQAYAAAEAGLNYYEAQLRRDNEFWRTCGPSDAPWISGRPWTGVGPDPRRWRTIPGSEGRYTIELLPANGRAACDTARPEQTMLDEKTSTFRIRSTGLSRGIKRSIVATFRRTGFLDFLYFTDYETSDPATYTSQQQRDWAQANCVKPREGRPPGCNEITFTDRDSIAGPFHTNDDIQICGSPGLGRDDGQHLDDIEISGPARNGYVQGCPGSSSPNVHGRFLHPAKTLTMPDSNDQLGDLAAADYRLTGTNRLVLNGNGTMTVAPLGGGSPRTLALPANGVIYDAQGASCSGIASPLAQTYSDDTGCPILYVRGTATRSLTIASAADIVLDGDLGHSPGAVVGLVAGNFVRVYHPVNRSRGCGSSSANGPGSMYDVHVDAAILALKHSFIVDNYDCGPLGHLYVTGAIAQEFRGPVGTFNSSTGQTATGYTKAYTYDDNLKQISPPYFLNPVAAPWRVARSNEQVPAT